MNDIADLFSSLPTSLACAILRDWLKLKSTIKLNSAFCNRSSRHIFLELLRSDEYSVLERVIVPRDIKRLEAKYLGLCKLGGKVRHVQIMTGFLAEEAAFVANQFPNLTHVHFNGMTDIAPELWTLIESPHIKCLRLTYWRCFDVASAHPALEKNGHKICTLDFCMADISLSAFSQITRLCPNVESLSLAGTGVTDDVLKEIVVACPHIKHLDLQQNDVLTDEGMLSVVQSLSALESLNIAELTSITGASLKHIYTHCAGQLHTLYFSCEEEMQQHFSSQVVNTLLQRCTKLHTLSFSDFDLESTGILLEPASLATLTTIILSGAVINDNNLVTIGQHAVNVQTLAIASFRSCHANAILALCLGCPKLRVIHVDVERHNYDFECSNIKALAEVAMLLWTRLRPGLKVHDFEDGLYEYRVMDM